ncbi:hypothetical protein BST81_17930 [Leptolyngbya sp. 'hensonii']|uniref:DUF3386 domain-containing protein n=1 Tax=Leptolyngbya sp. 'hensonii' TaxID=1922337 RepID=UPI00094FEA68|nr:DUF3386 domain-containing protein [Leptolyngbya sp. 'hensonii']OLP17222.1 hypothetical protein BST81_17930 [Leptolyngbya sp. 'hensonii']
MTEQVEAREIFQAAYENRYTWDTNFPGFSADVHLKQDDQVFTGKVRVTGDLKVEVLDVADDRAKEEIKQLVESVVTHRVRRSFEQAHGKNTFSLGQTDKTGAVEILVQGDAMGSNYKVRNREISQVSRVMGPTAFTIDHKATLDTGEGYVSIRYDAVFRSSQTDELLAEKKFEDTYEKIGNYYLITHQVVQTSEAGQGVVRDEFSFSNVKLLEPATV